MSRASFSEQKQGVLLINLGTPEAPDPDAVRKYLREFLMDPFVIDIPKPIRWFLVNVVVLPRRALASSKLYQKIWTTHGSPLRHNHELLVEKCRKRLGAPFHVEGAMRYGKPSIAEALTEFSRAKLEKLWVVPLYPQYSLAATESSVQAVRSEAARLGCTFSIDFAEPFYSRPEYLDCWAEQVRKTWTQEKYDFLLLSFHGLPERQVKKTDRTKAHCLKTANCCDAMVEANRDCYRAQCYETARGIAKRLKLSADQYEVCFQSRLGGTPWIRPFTDELYESLPSKGMTRVAVACPSFVADCLETLEEVAIRGEAQFKENGGERLTLVPSLNAEASWADALCEWIVRDLKAPRTTPKKKSAGKDHQPST